MSLYRETGDYKFELGPSQEGANEDNERELAIPQASAGEAVNIQCDLVEQRIPKKPSNQSNHLRL